MRLSATDLDAFRRWRDTEDADLGLLLAQLRRELPPSEPMLAGSAFHKALELSPYEDAADTLTANGYRFDMELDATLDLPMIRELKATRELRVDGEPVTLVCVADAVFGRRIDDHKFTGRFDADRFLAGFQWRVNLTVFDADRFRWNVFEGSQVEPGRYRVYAMHQLEAVRYPGMEDDVMREIRDFVSFARVYLGERFERAAA